uniref:Lipid-binding serum glycoprotein C-terminal domain-containing protein n=1 Tax=Acrobeloides nanus TaxID=290746 RepID=A0A914D0B8_9BILA
MVVKVVNRNGQPQLDVKQTSVDVGGLDISFSGDILAPIAEAIVNMMDDDIKDIVQKAVIENLQDAGASFTKAIDKIPMETEMHGSTRNFYINYMLTGDPWVANNDFIVPIISQFWYKGHREDNPPTIKPSGSYPIYSASRDACLDVDSNLMFASAAYAFNVSEQSKMVIADDVFSRLKPSLQHFFSCDCSGLLCFTTMFKELKKECTPGNRVKIDVVAKLQTEIHFNNTGAYILASAQSSFIAETKDYKNPVTLMELDAEVGIHLASSIEVKKWVVFGKVDVFYTKLAAKSPFIGDFPISLLDK